MAPCSTHCRSVSGLPQLSVKNLLKRSSCRKVVSMRLTPAAILLASQSPDRLRLLQQIGITPTVVVSAFEENLSKQLPVREFVEQTARGKLLDVLDSVKNKQQPFDVIIAADTVIYFDDRIIGKPTDAADAVATLKSFRNNTHLVYSGVAMAFADGSEETFSEESRIHFGDFPDSLIEEYVKGGEPLTRAGSYGIQRGGAVFVRGVEGCFSNIVGLPLYRVHQTLIKHNLV